MESNDPHTTFTGKCPHCGNRVNVEIILRDWKPGRKLTSDPEILQKIDSLLGTMTDLRISKMFGFQPATLCNRRRALGIPRFDKMNNAERWKEVDALLINHTDSEIVKKIRGAIGYAAVGKRRKMLNIPRPIRGDRESTKAKIFALHAQGINAREIGVAVRLTRQRVEQILIDKQ